MVKLFAVFAAVFALSAGSARADHCAAPVVQVQAVQVQAFQAVALPVVAVQSFAIVQPVLQVQAVQQIHADPVQALRVQKVKRARSVAAPPAVQQRGLINLNRARR